MPTKKTVNGWNLSCVGYELDCEGNVTMIWCKISREFYELMQNKATASSGIGQIGNILFFNILFSNEGILNKFSLLMITMSIKKLYFSNLKRLNRAKAFLNVGIFFFWIAKCLNYGYLIH